MEYVMEYFLYIDIKLGVININQIQTVDWWKWQQEDESLKLISGYIEQGKKPPFKSRSGLLEEVKLLLCDFQMLVVDKGVLYRKQEKEGQDVYQLVLPLEHCRTALEGLHDDAGHLVWRKP